MTEVEMLEKAAAQLGEHFDAVQILASFSCGGGRTMCIKRGSGNWYARQGMAHEFINSPIAEDTAWCIADKLKPPDDPEESWKQPS